MSETETASDLQLLARYNRNHAEDAFAELVRRHVDLVHSAGLRQVRSPQLAQEVAQSVFTDLARNAHRLTGGGDTSSPEASGNAPSLGSLTPWLYQVTRRTAIDVVRREACRQLREQIATEMNAMNATTAEWTHIEPLLDEGMAALDETDRIAVLLRYFENKSLREVGVALGTSDDAAQKRVSRAVERLREFFNKRGVTVGAGGLTVIISANAVQAAPAGLAITISTIITAGSAVATATATATKVIAVTALQKTLIGGITAIVVVAGIYEARQSARLQVEDRNLREQQTPLPFNRMWGMTGVAYYWAASDAAAAWQWSLSIADDETRRSSLGGVLRSLATRSQLDEAAKYAEQLTGDDQVRAVRSLLIDSSDLDPDWTARWVTKFPAGETRNQAVEKLVQHWSETQTTSVQVSTNAPPGEGDLPKDSWADVGFATPQSALQTRGWAVLNGNRERFKESVVITDGARKLMEDMLEKMIAAAPAAERRRASQDILNNGYGLEEAMLFPMVAENQAKGYTGYQIISQEAPSAGEMILQVATNMTSAPAKKETLKFRRVGGDWKVVIDEDFIKSQH